MTDDDVVERLLFGRDFEDSFVSPVVYDEGDAALWLEDSMSADDSPTQGQTKRKRRQRLTVKQEIEYLREKQRELRGQLDQLEVRSQLKGPATVWENRAKNQMAAAQRAMQENTELRTMLDAQLKTARALERVLKRKPYLELSSDISAQEWCMLRLGTDPEQRLHSMRAITDQVYEKLESEFIKSRIYDLKDGQCGMSVRSVGSALSFDYIQSMVTDTVGYDAMQTWMWSLMCHQVYAQDVPKFTSTGETLEMPEDNLAYIRADTTFVVKGAKTHIEGRWVVRMYVEANRTVFITQSIMDDALYPHAPDRKRDRSTCWAVLERHPTDPTKTRQYYLLQCVPGLLIESPDKGNTELMFYQGEMTEILLNVMRNCMESLKVATLRD